MLREARFGTQLHACLGPGVQQRVNSSPTSTYWVIAGFVPEELQGGAIDPLELEESQAQIRSWRVFSGAHREPS